MRKMTKRITLAAVLCFVTSMSVAELTKESLEAAKKIKYPVVPSGTYKSKLEVMSKRAKQYIRKLVDGDKSISEIVSKGHVLSLFDGRKGASQHLTVGSSAGLFGVNDSIQILRQHQHKGRVFTEAKVKNRSGVKKAFFVTREAANRIYSAQMYLGKTEAVVDVRRNKNVTIGVVRKIDENMIANAYKSAWVSYGLAKESVNNKSALIDALPDEIELDELFKLKPQINNFVKNVGVSTNDFSLIGNYLIFEYKVRDTSTKKLLYRGVNVIDMSDDASHKATLYLPEYKS